MLRKNGLHIRIQQEKIYQNDELFSLGFEKVLRMQASVIESQQYEMSFFYCAKIFAFVCLRVVT